MPRKAPLNTHDTVLIVPAYNEAECIATLLREVAREAPPMDILLIDDGSIDATVRIAREHGAAVLSLVCNLGVGGAVQAGLTYALERDYRYCVRCDADGQHPPAEIDRLLNVVRTGRVDLAVGSRFLGDGQRPQSLVRSIGIRTLSAVLSIICRCRVTDPTSGFHAFNTDAMRFFARCYPTDYPEPEALALMRRYGFTFQEVGVTFRERQGGTSTLGGWDTLYYAFKVFLALCVDRTRGMDPTLTRSHLLGTVA